MGSKTQHRIDRQSSATIGPWRQDEPRFKGVELPEQAIVDCGWGKLIFAHTFRDNEALVASIRDEPEGQRNLALYLKDPHVVLSLAPQRLFLDPSHTYRLWLAHYLPGRIQPAGFTIRRLQNRGDCAHINRLLVSRGMISAEPDFIWNQRASKSLEYFVAEDPRSGRIIGTVMGVDHAEAFADPENGSSMWCLAVDPQAAQPGIGRSLVAYIADHYAARGRAFMDLSVMHDNAAVIGLYAQLGFERVPAFCIKTKNAINQALYMGRQPEQALNPYAQIIVDEALRRGVVAETVDAEHGYFALQYGGRRVLCRESLSELTSAIAMSRCDDKTITHAIARGAGISVPAQCVAVDDERDAAFLATHGAIVVKPARGEQGRGISVNVTDPDELDAAIQGARAVCDRVLLEQYVAGDDLRVVVIDFAVVAAAIRRPAAVEGNGRHTVRELIEKQSRRRAAATGGESTIPLDAETERCIAKRGYALDDVLDHGVRLQVRETANLHTGGTLHDVTAELGATLTEVSERLARALGIPVVGLDFIVRSADADEYVLIEANERPGLANHEPQPTAERFVDLLFPQTAESKAGKRTSGRREEAARAQADEQANPGDTAATECRGGAPGTRT